MAIEDFQRILSLSEFDDVSLRKEIMTDLYKKESEKGDWVSFPKLNNGGAAGAPGSSFRNTTDDFGGIDIPKNRFLFTVSFRFRNERELAQLGLAELGGRELYESSYDFAVRQATRPTININYSDVNYYNFRTKVATKMDWGAVNITFYDDSKNRAHKIFEKYLKAVSPIARTGVPKNADAMQFAGMDGAGGIGPLRNGNQMGPIKYIILTHHTNTPELSQPEGEYQRVYYVFINPKIINAVLDELDMAQSDVTTVVLGFNFDSVFITDKYDLDNVMNNEVPTLSSTTSRDSTDPNTVAGRPIQSTTTTERGTEDEYTRRQRQIAEEENRRNQVQTFDGQLTPDESRRYRESARQNGVDVTNIRLDGII